MKSIVMDYIGFNLGTTKRKKLLDHVSIPLKSTLFVLCQF